MHDEVRHAGAVLAGGEVLLDHVVRCVEEHRHRLQRFRLGLARLLRQHQRGRRDVVGGGDPQRVAFVGVDRAYAGGAQLHVAAPQRLGGPARSEEHTSELQSLMRTSYAVFCLTTHNNTFVTTPAIHSHPSLLYLTHFTASYHDYITSYSII